MNILILFHMTSKKRHAIFDEDIVFRFGTMDSPEDIRIETRGKNKKNPVIAYTCAFVTCYYHFNFHMYCHFFLY